MAGPGASSLQREGDHQPSNRAALEAVRRAPVIIGFSTPRRFNVLSWAIRKITGSRASHAWLRVVDPLFHLDMVMEAHTTGMRLIPRAVFEKGNAVVALAYPQGDFSTALGKAGKFLGRKYDFEGLLGMAWVLLGRWLHRKWRNPLNSTKALFCSEAVVEMLQAAKYPGAERLAADSTSPEDLLEFLQDGSFECPVQFADERMATRRRHGRRHRETDQLTDPRRAAPW